MAEIKRFLWLRHLRAEQSLYVLHHRAGKLVHQGRGAAYWFLPLSAAIAQVPLDDRELVFHFHGASRDFQDVSIQGVITYRVTDPQVLADRIDFSIDLRNGAYLKEPLESLSLLLTQLAQQFAWDYLSTSPLRTLLADGHGEVRNRISTGLGADASLRAMGLEIVAVRISAMQPTPELERALQMPTREAIQQQADEATFQRRALAVEKERAIQENELQNKIELARREALLIEEQGRNARQSATEEAEAERIAVEARARDAEVMSLSEAANIRAVEGARLDAEERRMAIFRDLPASVTFGLAARELAGKLQRIDHLNIAPEMLGPLMTHLVQAGTRHLERMTPTE